MNAQDIHTAFQNTFKPDPREGLTFTPGTEDGLFRVQVRHQDVDELRGFDVVAQPTETDEKGAQAWADGVIEVVNRELAYGQLPARGDDGEFKRIVV